MYKAKQPRKHTQETRRLSRLFSGSVCCSRCRSGDAYNELHDEREAAAVPAAHRILLSFFSIRIIIVAHLQQKIGAGCSSAKNQSSPLFGRGCNFWTGPRVGFRGRTLESAVSWTEGKKVPGLVSPTVLPCGPATSIRVQCASVCRQTAWFGTGRRGADSPKLGRWPQVWRRAGHALRILRMRPPTSLKALDGPLGDLSQNINRQRQPTATTSA